ncbi:MAG: hypothetical protein KDC52_00990 [Ignavibacteriae bacterium]|nr:hypothetical protein [Ignavibacteriota bacterium]
MFKRKRYIERNNFNYHKYWHFNNAYLVIDFQFKNAIWYKVGNIKSIDFSKPLILNLENIHTDNINFEVFGFFQKQVYTINLNKVAEVNSESFKTQIHNLNLKLTNDKIRFRLSDFAITNGKTVLNFDNIKVETPIFQINYKPFKIREYI